MADPLFDDYLRLAERDFSRHRLIAFCGASGSGKSTAVEYLLSEHRDFQGRPHVWVDGPPFRDTGFSTDVLVLDDVIGLTDYLTMLRLLRRAKTLLVASHLSTAHYRPLQWLVTTAVFRTDADPGKIERYLERRGVQTSKAAVREFVALFGATYTDVDIILERYPDRSFDQSLALFRRFSSIELNTPRPQTPV